MTADQAAATTPAVAVGAGDRLVWTMPDGAVIYVRVTRVDHRRDVIYLRCHRGDRVWTRRHDGPLFPSMRPGDWTAADLLDQL